ncbi:anthranilate synthase component I family protein [Nocardioides sp. HDW12B]|nr:anthranilate synthase component I family protein [Nocardioides sp. HDW12B]
MFWLDGGGARRQAGVATSSALGVLADDDVSLTFDATARQVRRHQHGRSTVVGDDVFAVLGDEVDRDGGDPEVSWVGYLGYACRPDLPGRPSATPGVPDAVWMRVRTPEPLPRTSYETVAGATTPPDVRGGAGSGQPAADAGEPVPEEYAAAFAEVQEQLHAGNSYEVNLTYREAVRSGVDPVTAYVRLRSDNPAPYSGYLQHHGVHLLSSSPERYATVDRQRVLEARPIKGTTPRGRTPAEDAALAAHLRADPKLRAENLMITDLIRNDLALVCDVGSVEVPGLMEVESYAAVHQLVTTVRGRLRDDVPTIAALRALFPAGSMTGAPKRRTMSVIDAVEATPRGVYAGAFGWISGDGRADLSVVIRSLVATAAGSGVEGWRYELGTGGGITVRSDLAEEWAETRWKSARVRACLA